MVGWLINQHNGLRNADFDEGMNYSMEIKVFDLVGVGRSRTERELHGKGRKDASQDDDRLRNIFFQLST